jgi:hypothetical protein
VCDDPTASHMQARILMQGHAANRGITEGGGMYTSATSACSQLPPRCSSYIQAAFTIPRRSRHVWPAVHRAVIELIEGALPADLQLSNRRCGAAHMAQPVLLGRGGGKKEGAGGWG